MQTDFTKQDLIDSEVIAFNNFNKPWEDSFEVEAEFQQITSWDNPFKLFVNGELKATFKTFVSLKNNAERLINAHGLERAV
jgi:hypothetical protein